MKPLGAWFASVGIIAATWWLLMEARSFLPVPAAEGNTLTIVLIDGMSSSIFNDELRLGKLPVLSQLIKKSLYVENGISAFPTMTGYGFYPFITGIDASESGIYGLRWFDKERNKGQLRNYVGRTNVQMNHDLHPEPKTFFELAGADYTASVNTYMNRGVKESVKTGFAHTTAKYEGKTWLTYLSKLPWVGRNWIKNHFQHETAVTDIALEQLKKKPKIQWITYASPDAYNHINGTHDHYRLLLRHIDYEIGRLLAVLSTKPHKRRAFAVISDHGIRDVNQNLDLCLQLQKSTGLSIDRGKSAILYSTDMTTTQADLKDLEAYLVINGNLSAYIYMLGENKEKLGAAQLEKLPLKNGRTINLPSTLVNTEGIELCLYWDQKNKEVVVLHKRGKSRIAATDTTFKYTVVEGEDPLGYQKDGSMDDMVNQGHYPKDMWLQNSIASKYPDALFRFYNLMSKEKSGDLLVTAAEGYDLAKDYEAVVSNYKGGHGDAGSDIILVPYIYYEPNKPASRATFMRAEQLGIKFKAYLFGKKDQLPMISR
ncbi:MAG TPA: alkaline phosphatase family protein [Saprospiraceae bacterium]|nr:alkaline phosphatase family protein [Saprospiraceae bacterium]